MSCSHTGDFWVSFFWGCASCIARLPPIENIEKHRRLNQLPYTIMAYYNSYKPSPEMNEALTGKGYELLINMPDENGKTAIYHAVMSCNISFVEYLLEKGADPFIISFDGESAYSISSGDIKILLENAIHQDIKEPDV